MLVGPTVGLATTTMPTSISLATGASSRRQIGRGRVRQVRIDQQRAGRTDRQRVAIGRRFGQGNEAERSATADVVLNHHRPAAALAEPGRDRARDAVGRCTRVRTAR